MATRQRLLGSHARGQGLAFADGGAPLVDQAVVVPIPKVHTMLPQLFRRVPAEVDADG